MDPTAALQARLPTNLRSVGTRLLTVDNTVRKYTLSPGGWRLYGSTTAVFAATRYASAADGTLSTGEVAPTMAELAAPAAGSPGAGVAWPPAATVTALPLPTTADVYEEIAVAAGGYMALYVGCATTATVRLVGPFT